MNASAVKAQRARWRERVGIGNLGVISPSDTLPITMGRSRLLEFERNASDQGRGLTASHRRRRWPSRAVRRAASGAVEKPGCRFVKGADIGAACERRVDQQGGEHPEQTCDE